MAPIWLGICFICSLTHVQEATAQQTIDKISEPIYKYDIVYDWIPVPDTHNQTSKNTFTNLSVTLIIPQQLSNSQSHTDEIEKFPVLVEYLPYRKDDSFYSWDFEMFDFFGKRGYIYAKVDIRGTGSSFGMRPDREYSDIELSDGEYMLKWLSTYKYSNGKIGMFGISWSAINSLMLAHRPNISQYLKAVFVFHASDDLYNNDIHYMNGVKHFDEYICEIDHENGLPNPLKGYQLDDDYFETRFNQEPFIFTYLKHQIDNWSFWRKNSVLYNLNQLADNNVALYLYGGLLDGYRDYALHIYNNVTTRWKQQGKTDLLNKIKVTIGPWRHDTPEEAVPGPQYEFKYEMIRWFDLWLKDKNTILNSSLDNMNIFVRDYYPPIENIQTIPGKWKTFKAWPTELITDKVEFCMMFVS